VDSLRYGKVLVDAAISVINDQGVLSSSAMNGTFAKALAAMVPTGISFVGSALLFVREKTVGSFLQLLGAGCLVIVALADLCEALHLFCAMQWGSEHSAGHYLDLGSAVFGFTLFPVGYWLHALTKRHA
jgi:hypothetical protein